MSTLSVSLDTLVRSPWAIYEPTLKTVATNIARKLEQDGEVVLDRKEDIEYEVVNGKAVIEVEGIFYNKMMIDEYWGYVKLDLEKTLIAAVDDTNVDEIVLKINSPGGVIYGVSEIHDLILELKKVKPINAYINGMACSALYWIPSACTNIYGYSQCDVGSIGVYMMAVDWSGFLEEMGIKVEYIKAGKYKTAGNPYEPMSPEIKSYFQNMVDVSYNDFTSAVAKARNLDLEKRNEWAEGQVFEMNTGVELGLVDAIKSWQEVLGYEKTSFSLKKGWRNIMAIGEPKIADLKADQLQATNPKLYESIYETGFKAGEAIGQVSHDELKAENDSLKAKLQEFESEKQKAADHEKIRNFAKSLDLAERGEALISENKTVVEAFDILAVEAEDAKVEGQNKFKEGAPKAAGLSSDTIADELPKTDVEAREYCQKKYNLKTRREAWRKARQDFPALFGTTTKEGE